MVASLLGARFDVAPIDADRGRPEKAQRLGMIGVFDVDALNVGVDPKLGAHSLDKSQSRPGVRTAGERQHLDRWPSGHALSSIWQQEAT